MSKARKNEKSEHDYVPLLYARNLEEAEYYQDLLKEHEIPTLIDEKNAEVIDPDSEKPGIPVLVSDEHLDEAEAILDQQESLDEVMGGANDDYEDEDDDDEDENEHDGLEPFDPDDELGNDLGLDDDEDEEGMGDEEEERF